MPPKTNPDTALARQIADAALLRGRFVLRSGKTSSYYLDKYRLSTNPALLTKLADRFADRIRSIAAENEHPIDRLAGAELGGIPLVTAASLATNIPSVFVRNQKKTYGTNQQLEGPIEPADRVIFLEDVATTGGQAAEAVAVLRHAGADVLAVICAIDRQQGARQTIESTDTRFEALFTKADLGIDD